MTEQEWLTSDDPPRMLERLKNSDLWTSIYPPKGTVSDRKLRLFCVACQEHFLPDRVEPYRVAVESDGQTDDFLRHLLRVDVLAGLWVNVGMLSGSPLLPKCNRQEDQPWKAALLRTIVGNPFKPVTLPNVLPKRFCRECQSPMVMEANHRHQLGLWRCWMNGNHVTSQVTVDEMRIHKSGPCPWLTHADGTVPKLAQVIYDERQWDLMPMLADALEEAGCHDEVILRWCRGQELCPDCMGEGELRAGSSAGIVYSQCKRCVGPDGYGTGWILRRGPSVRGDWCIDLLLGKE